MGKLLTSWGDLLAFILVILMFLAGGVELVPDYLKRGYLFGFFWGALAVYSFFFFLACFPNEEEKKEVLGRG